MKIILPNYVKKALKTLHNAGFDAWIVGGSVRDSIMGKPPQDYDIATSAKPQQVINLFERTIPTGVKHGTVTVLIDKNSIEITTFRTESGYNDSRHPDSVSFVLDITEDLSRRDFTVNAIAYNEENGLFDPFDGYNDIKNKILKTVGDAKTRFNEDALRIMRLFRFASQLEFEIDEQTFLAANDCAPLLIKISPERVREELIKTLCGNKPEKLNFLLKTNCLSHLGLLDNYYVRNNICFIPAKANLRFIYFCYSNSIDIQKICKTLKTSNNFLKECESVVSLLNNHLPESKADIKRILSNTHIDYFKSYISIYEALSGCENLSDNLSDILKNNEPYKIEMLKISGEDLKMLGYSGRNIGKTLNFLLDKVIKNPEKNTVENLKALL